MTLWFWATGALMLGLVPCGIVLARGSRPDRLIALELAGMQTILVLLALAGALQAGWALNLALLLAILALPAALVFTRTLNWWA